MINSADPLADRMVSHALLKSLSACSTPISDFVFFCIGTPCVSGDRLGPYIGSCLDQIHLPLVSVYGTLTNPIHALNLSDKLAYAKKKHPSSFFIAIDASFGPKTHLGNICIENSPLHPGQGVGKTLPPVGDIGITSVVCSDCIMRQKQLAKIPFSFIQSQAHPILHGIFQSLLYFYFK